jgi:hypothetical protein
MSNQHEQAWEALKVAVRQTEQQLKAALHKNDLNIPNPDVQYQMLSKLAYMMIEIERQIGINSPTFITP